MRTKLLTLESLSGKGEGCGQFGGFIWVEAMPLSFCVGEKEVLVLFVLAIYLQDIEKRVIFCDLMWNLSRQRTISFFRYSAFLSCFSSLMLNGSQDLQPTYLLKLSMLPSLVWLNQQWLELLDISGRGVEWKCSSLLVSKVGSAGLTGSRKISGSASEIIYLEEIKKIRKKYK